MRAAERVQLQKEHGAEETHSAGVGQAHSQSAAAGGVPAKASPEPIRAANQGEQQQLLQQTQAHVVWSVGWGCRRPLHRKFRNCQAVTVIQQGVLGAKVPLNSGCTGWGLLSAQYPKQSCSDWPPAL